MMGRAGRPQFDQKGVAVIMVHEPKKQFYKRFLYEPFPVESALQGKVRGLFEEQREGEGPSFKNRSLYKSRLLPFFTL